MITRGHYIGEIVDSLTEISSKANMRASLGLTDLNVHLENFFRDILNRIYSYNLSNLNSSRSNEPGLDLGDVNAAIAYQITTVKTSQKVNETLEKITKEQQTNYTEFKILIIGSKQSSYTLKEDAEQLGFTVGDIIDLDHVCRDIMALKIEDLQSLYRYMKDNSAKISIEMDIPNEDGVYPVSILNFKERIPNPQIGTGEQLLQYLVENGMDDGADLQRIVAELESFSKKLERLPRISREFYAAILEGREPDERRPGFFGDAGFYYNADRLERQFTSFASLRAETRLLMNDEFLSYDDPGDHDVSPVFNISIPSESGDLYYWLTNYMDDKNLSYLKVIGSMDFGEF